MEYREDKLNELLALSAIFTSEGEFEVFSPELIAFISSGDADFVSNTTHMKCRVVVMGELRLDFTLPPRYPLNVPVTVCASCSRLNTDTIMRLNSELKSLALQEVGSPSIFTLIEFSRAWFSKFRTDVNNSSSKGSDTATTINAEIPRELLPERVSSVSKITRVFFWTHHMRVKQKFVYKISSELKVTGLCKIGRPGWIFAEGESANMKDFIRRVKHERWKEIRLRWQQDEEVEENTEIDSLRLFPNMLEMTNSSLFCKKLKEINMHEALRAGTGVDVVK